MRILHFLKNSFSDSMGGTEKVINEIVRGANFFAVIQPAIFRASFVSPW